MSTNIISSEQLKQYVARIERLEEDKANVSTDLKEVFAEAKGNGFDIKTLRKIIQLRKKDKGDLEQEEELLNLYRQVIGV